MNTYTPVAVYLTILVLLSLHSPLLTTSTYNHLNGTGLFITLGQTLWTTSLIAYRIYSASKGRILKKKQSRFINILEIIIQSSFIYSLSLAVFALLLAIPVSKVNFLAIGVAGIYASSINFVITVRRAIKYAKLAVTLLIRVLRLL